MSQKTLEDELKNILQDVKVDAIEEISEREYTRYAYQNASKYQAKIEQLQSALQQVNFLTHLGYKVKFYRSGDNIYFDFKEPERVGY